MKGVTHDELEEGTLIEAKIFELPPGSRCSHSYWLPADFPETENWEHEHRRGLGRNDIHISWVQPLQWEREQLLFPLTHETRESINVAEETIALANHVYLNGLLEAAEETLFMSTLTHVSNQRGSIRRLGVYQLWRATVMWGDVDKVVSFKKLWREDARVRVYEHGLTSDPCAFGSVWGVHSLGNMSFEIILALQSVSHRNAPVDLFDLVARTGREVTIRLVPCITRVQSRSECWITHKPSKLAQGNGSRGRILAAFLGLIHPNPLTAVDLSGSDLRDAGGILNEEQLLTYRWILSGSEGILRQIAPCGSGKTFCIAIAIAQLLRNDPTANVVLTTRNNNALHRLVEEVVGLLNDIDSLVILSGPAKDIYAEDFGPYRSHLLVASAEDLVGVLGNQPERRKDVNILSQYVEDCAEQPRKAGERKALGVVSRHRKNLPRVILATTSMLEDLPLVTQSATHIVIDESGQGNVDQTTVVVCEAPKLKQLVLTGDERQLLNYVVDVPKMVRDFGSESLLTYLPKLSDDQVTRVVLKKTYRFHPIIAKCLAATGYGDQLVVRSFGR